MYEWRKLSAEDREEILAHRKRMKLPWHSPPHFEASYNTYLISAANYNHQIIIGDSLQRMAEFQCTLLEVISKYTSRVYAWCVLPNHYHIVIETNDLRYIVYGLGQMHGRLSRFWNLEDKTLQRKCWNHCMDRAIRTERHLYTAVNYVHYNPIKHGLVDRMSEWFLSSFEGFVEVQGLEKSIEIWKKFPILEMGINWDD